MKTFITPLLTRRWFLIGGIIVGIVALQILEATGRLPSLLSPSHRLDKADLTDSVLCGPRSLLIAMNRLGIPVELDGIVDECTVSETGVTFRDLQEVAEARGLKTQLRQLNWTQLKSLETTCVLFVGNNHFVAVDTREPDPNSQQAGVRVYDPDHVARWWSQKDLESVWNGETLSLVRGGIQPVQGPRAEWTTCWTDVGLPAAVDHADYSMTCRNTGSQPLELEVIGTSCACTDGRVDRDVLLPGETAEISGAVRLHEKRGLYTERIVVRTNDPSCPTCRLWLCGGAVTDTILSARELFLGDIVPGSVVEKEFYVHDPGSGGMQIDSVTYQTKPENAIPDGVQVQLTTRAIEANSSLFGQMRGRYAVMPGDYEVRIRVAVAPECPAAVIDGQIQVRTSLPGRLGEVTAQIHGNVLSDVTVSPKAALLFRTDMSDTPVRKVITVSRVSGHPLNLRSVQVSGEIPFCVRQTVDANQPDSASIEVSCNPDVSYPASVETEIIVTLQGGNIVRIPLFYRSKSGG